ncbi:efflux transporter outer membrane subunit [Paucibacter sp. DJ2R-2]|uniref:efflux transporter outer membrane subunit n=1 Tax=Paucibacter sp. DJ2R-2 TaxID=2893558 RepID=UPI0021E47FE2|nr:efflux transporter outer membrane subunit [Paucibacter sp. DJ2R-2]MCV2423485.1 efflux transporter outer membrane subunit [Paucibacter sp. DJ4R-1]MCV2441362.1 efflux transporter outer membrane subunit [Paucibacter sp. DJ2R-2]
MSLSKSHPLKRLTLLLSLPALLAACALQPALPPAASRLAPSQLGLSDDTAADTAGRAALPRSDWWTELQSPELNALMQRALNEAPSLAQARARIQRAQASIDNAESSERAAIGLGLDAARQRFPEHSVYPPPLAGTLRNTATLQASASYEWDFFGRHQAELNAALGSAQAARADAAAAQLMLSSQLARSYVQLARVLAQRELLARQSAEREQALSLVRQRSQAGLDTAQDLRAAELPIPELRRQALQLDEQADLLRHQLAALSAQPMAALKDLKPALPTTLPLAGEGALGLDLLGRRPDVVAARWRVEAATAQVSSARAQFYPNISLGAFVGFNAIGFDNLLKAGSLQYGVAPSLRLPLFDSGRLRAQLRGSAAEADAAVAAYNSALLEAVRDASDQLRSLRSLQEQKAEQAAAQAHVQAALELARQRHNAGLGNRLAVLNASQSLLQQQRQALDLQAQTIDAQLNLLRSLGGGWTEAKP